MGGNLSLDTDMFTAVDTSEVIRKGNYDAYDFFDEENYKMDVIKEPDMRFKIGSDWK